MDLQDSKLTSKYLGPLLGGALAGLAVDVAMYPLDTLKTRLQSQQGFYKAGGFGGVYKGLLTVASTSMPTASLFFVSYEATKNITQPLLPIQYAPLVHLLAANIAEVLACLIRVPTEVAKQRKQTFVGGNASSISILVQAFRTEGLCKGVYRGFLSTVLRDVPFSSIQFPLWELFKKMVQDRSHSKITSFESAVCGAAAGALAAAATTPLDVAKTRIMLATDGSAHKVRIAPVLAHIYAERGIGGLFAGVGPRVTNIFIGGFVFFGMYEKCKMHVEIYLDS
ncbi:S-adenosylmethionine mitochondrial carrier protein homolog [Aricia agestis]|uniref:S-adenosylmethionine mitochondrial carrier protein homolog n=1 Tax=Aricia agestis TaxID=91739 RepID=UPI001C20591A|nr:S-adenosylmethionine mitochondrial carrier protein homolog [Aricia agestis]